MRFLLLLLLGWLLSPSLAARGRNLKKDDDDDGDGGKSKSKKAMKTKRKKHPKKETKDEPLPESNITEAPRATLVPGVNVTLPPKVNGTIAPGNMETTAPNGTIAPVETMAPVVNETEDVVPVNSTETEAPEALETAPPNTTTVPTLAPMVNETKDVATLVKTNMTTLVFHTTPDFDNAMGLVRTVEDFFVTFLPGIEQQGESVVTESKHLHQVRMDVILESFTDNNDPLDALKFANWDDMLEVMDDVEEVRLQHVFGLVHGLPNLLRLPTLLEQQDLHYGIRKFLQANTLVDDVELELTYALRSHPDLMVTAMASLPPNTTLEAYNWTLYGEEYVQVIDAEYTPVEYIHLIL